MRNRSSSATSSSVSPGNPTITLLRAPASGASAADPSQDVEERVGRAEPLHPPQHRRAGVLEGQVEVRRDAWGRGDRVEQGRTQFGRLQVGDPDPFDAVDGCEIGQQLLQRAQVAEVLAVGRRVLADQYQFARRRSRPATAASASTSAGGPRDERAAKRRDRAERAPTVAPRRQLEICRRSVVEAAPGHAAGQPGVPGTATSCAAAGRWAGRDRQQGTPVARGVGCYRASGRDVVESLGDVGIASRTPARLASGNDCASSAP